MEENQKTDENSSISEMDDWIKTFDFKLPSIDESWRNNPPPESCLAPGIEIPFQMDMRPSEERISYYANPSSPYCTVTDRILNRKIAVNYSDLEMSCTPYNPMEYLRDRIVSERREVLMLLERFFLDGMRMGYPPLRLNLLGSTYGLRIITLAHFLGCDTQMDMWWLEHGIRAMKLSEEWNDSAELVMEKPTAKYSEYRMKSELKGFERIYTEFEHYHVSRLFSLTKGAIVDEK